jgi:hypothetical protein
MSGGAFILLKSGQNGRESAKQAEIRLANLLKILGIGASRGYETLAEAGKNMPWLYLRGFPPVMANWPKSLILLFGSQFLLGNWRSILHGRAGERSIKYWHRFLYVTLHKTVYSWRPGTIIHLQFRLGILALYHNSAERTAHDGSVGSICTSRRWFPDEVPNGMQA